MDNSLTTSVLTFSRISTCLVFALSSFAKLRDAAGFRQTLALSLLVNGPLLKLVAFGVLLAEAAVAVLMVLGGEALVVGFVLATLLLCVFSAFLVSALRRGLRASCHCFGPSNRTIRPADLARNAGFISFALVGWAIVSTSAAPLSSMPQADTFLVGLMAAVFVFLLVHLPEIAEVLRP